MSPLRLPAPPGFVRLFFALMALAVALPWATLAQKEKGVGLTMSGDADPKDIGLPLYPGSRRHKEKDEDSAGINFGAWGSGAGVKLAVLKMESDDSPDKVAGYYKKKLAKYGKVLDCSHVDPSAKEGGPNESDKKDAPLTCGDDKPDKGGLLFKSGTQQDQHLVSIQAGPHGGSMFQLVHSAHWDK